MDANAREAVVIVAETDERAKENAEGDDGANGGSGGGPVPRVFPLRPSDLASNAYRVTESRAAMLLPKRSAAPVPAPSAQKKKLRSSKLFSLLFVKKKQKVGLLKTRKLKLRLEKREAERSPEEKKKREEINLIELKCLLDPTAKKLLHLLKLVNELVITLFWI